MELSSNSDSSHNAKTRGSWARRTGFKSNLSGESGSIASESESRDVEMGATPAARNPNPQPAATSGRRETPTSVPEVVVASSYIRKETNANGSVKEKESGSTKGLDGHVNRPAPAPSTPVPPPTLPTVPARSTERVRGSSAGGQIRVEPVDNGGGQIRVERMKGHTENDVDLLSQSQDSDDEHLEKHSHMKYELRENPGYVSLVLYGFQHYISMIGSLILIPLIIVPAMGGEDKDTAYVVSSVLLVSGISTLLHTSFGSRLPLIQGASFVYLAPALAIINSSDFTSRGNNRFKATMRELQGAIIVASVFQVFLGYSGLMNLFLRLINPVVVAPTVAAVGLSFFTYGFPVVGTCFEIGIPQILLIVFFALHLRKVSIMGHRIFQIYAVPLGLGITWAYAFLLTATGAYSFKGCDFSVPSSNILSESCRRHAYTMQHCRTDTSKALKLAAWIRFPYPLQWGIPTFHYKTAFVMIVVSIIASVDSVGSYHASSLLVASRAPSRGVVGRGIGMEGITSALAGLWGIGTGATTLTENVHTIAVTKMGSRRSVEIGACLMIAFSFVGKVGALLASIPQVIVAGLLCVMWAMLAALGLSNLRYSETGSSRNVVIVGLALFLSLSIPAYFQDYGVSPDFVATTSSTLQPYIVASHGPFQTSFIGLNFILNTLISMNMLIAFVVAFLLDNTVPGSKQERGVYVWFKGKSTKGERTVLKDYGLPFGLGRCFRWVKWVGL
ncbi:hypothetical protein KP509_13G007000 [Ceratopteris richardii]|uniref:Nucleobase-ascorbate transporter 11 n=2 Tax=Ceratopteris richardii TaxID=49495 RepID=A0A8T2TD19_CERRI|nr:hypothetical protein KP509_13G007000 [Ceratopteris richardii]